MDTPKFPHHRDCEALTGITLDQSEAFEVKLTTFLGYVHQNRAALDALMFTMPPAHRRRASNRGDGASRSSGSAVCCCVWPPRAAARVPSVAGTRSRSA